MATTLPPRRPFPVMRLPNGEPTTPDALAQAVLDTLYTVQGRLPEVATTNDWYVALSLTVRGRLMRRWIASVETVMRKDTKVVAYLSAEFLMGPYLGNSLVNLGILAQARAAMDQLGIDLDEVLAREEEPGLGNGGLGRLAACYLDSLASLEVPAIGYGIRYEFGIFDQEIRDGWQVEITDRWLRFGNPWEIARPEIAYEVGFGGHTETGVTPKGRYRVRWTPARIVKGIAHDTPVPGYGVGTVDLLRLWKSEAVESFDFKAFNVGDYWGAVEEKVDSENLSKVLYPNDEPLQGKRLRLEQQYFFVSCSLQDMIRIHLTSGNPIETFHELFAVQLNDTHPSIGVAELMRLLLDVHGLDWEPAWEITRRTFAYTNHTLLPEALETWPLPLFASILPRHLEIILEINRRFLDEVRRRFPVNDSRIARLSLIDERGEKSVRMANLATVGSHTVNGVAALHTQLLTRDVLHDFYELEPKKFVNVTNGVTPRRWMVLSNPPLASLLTQRIGDRWIHDTAGELPRLEPLADDEGFRAEWRQIKTANKRDLAQLIRDRTGVVVDPESLFDVQVKRIHEYKRQHLNVLHVISLYEKLKHGAATGAAPRTVIFGGKAAPGYFMAKLIIRLIHGVAEVVNADASTRDLLRVVFVPDFNVTVGQRIYPAADLSEQISTAGKEASGTGNMKFALNGALTIGTLDGANVEIRAAVGPENFFLFGLEADQVRDLKTSGYDPRAYLATVPELQPVIDRIAAGDFSRGDRALYRPLVDALLNHDTYMLLADFASYLRCQENVAAAFEDRARWDRMSVLNVARSGRFSSDRAIREYCDRIWKVRPRSVPIA